MKNLLALSMLTVICMTSSRITSNLQIISYDPLLFNLSFSEQVNLPQFQLLFNNENIGYNLSTTETMSDWFSFEAEMNGIFPSDYITETYTLIFNFPLSIKSKNGNLLSLNSFILNADKSSIENPYFLESAQDRKSIYQYQNSGNNSLTILAIIIVSLAYTISLIDISGLWMIDFIQIYTFVQLYSDYWTSFDYQMAFFLLFDVHHLEQQVEIYQLLYLFIPLFLVLVSFVLGVSVRFGLENLAASEKKWKIIHEYFGYKFFIVMWRVMLFPIWINTLHLLEDYDHFQDIDYGYCLLISYFGFLCLAVYFYFAILVMNPRRNQSKQHWEKYKASSHFKKFRGFYSGLKLENWYERNYNIFISAKRILIGLFAIFMIPAVPNLVIQILHTFYLFTVRPFVIPFYHHSSIIMQILIVFIYLLIYCANLYLGMSSYINTSSEINLVMVLTIVFFVLLIAGFVGLGIYELYEKITKVRKRIHDEKEQKRRYEVQENSALVKQTGKTLYSDKLDVDDRYNCESPRQKNESRFYEEGNRSRRITRPNKESIKPIKIKSKIKESLLESVAKQE